MKSLFLALSAAIVACGASYPPPTDQYSGAEKDLGRAQEAGSVNVPDAKLHLVLAQESLAKAKQQMNVDNERAMSLVLRASAEADLAYNLARRAKAQAEAQQANDALARTRGGGS